MPAVVECGEVWESHTEEISYSALIIKDGGDYYHARSLDRLKVLEGGFLSAAHIDLDKLDKTVIPVQDIWPSLEPDLTCATEEQIRNVDNYIKRPSLLHYALGSPAFHAKDLILKEARICEILLSSPHPNIVEYHGVVEEEGLIHGLCFEKLPRTLSQCMGLSFAAEYDMENIDVEKCLSGMADGIAHLHSLGLVHNDINPGNIMLRDGFTPVIIDFDSCEWEGHISLRRWALVGSSETRERLAGIREDREGVTGSKADWRASSDWR